MPVARALVEAFQWRLLLLWLAALTLPTALVAWPFWQALGHAVDHAPNAAALARTFDTVTMLEATLGWRTDGYSPGSGIGSGLFVTLLLSPWLSGLALTAAASDRARPPGFRALALGGFAHYGRLARMLLWSLLPLGLAAGVAALLRHVVDLRAEHAILESDVDMWRNLVWLVAALLFAVVHAGLDAGRARFVLEPWRRSAVRAWWRGVRALVARPVATLGCYLAVTLLGLAAAGGLGLVRLHLPPIGPIGFLLAWLTTQLIVATVAWMRCARLFALVAVGRGG